MRRPVWLSPAVLVIFAAGATMMSVSMGSRQAQGLLMGPLSDERGWPLATFSLAVALHNLLWGAFQPFTGAAADRFGAARVAAVGAVCFAAGMALVATGGTFGTILGLGLVSGFGLAATSFAVVLGPVGRAVAPEHRTIAMGIGSALGSLGMMAMIPVAQGLIGALGPTGAVWVMAGFSLATLPMALLLAKGERMAGAAAVAAGQSMAEALREAWGHKGFRLLTAGFFVCGFQVAFIGVHLPGYLALCGMSQGAGATALFTIGIFNVAGTVLMGRAAQRWRPKFVLSALYLGRAVVTLLFVLGPKTEITLLAFAAAIGLMWLSTVPPTTGLIACVFGPRYLGMLFGVVFFSHQVGAFLGAWLGGVIYDATLSYDAMWMVTMALGIFAALVHLPIRDESLRVPAAAG
ncbi:MFS transporter [Magnetospirillum sp. UT-4]|uniref:MFS transporter n=1 Tax=Magnetospirillum sp. UT-4 TaxID=2681467 RepID=UPI00137CE180|nr:MFS transporter [Magnetospirillum sp. UT-4]CAA7612178.1 Permease of the major facilitator superfamily [Magnetospirillum sp. UT-4]